MVEIVLCVSYIVMATGWWESWKSEISRLHENVSMNPGGLISYTFALGEERFSSAKLLMLKWHHLTQQGLLFVFFKVGVLIPLLWAFFPLFFNAAVLCRMSTATECWVACWILFSLLWAPQSNSLTKTQCWYVANKHPFLPFIEEGMRHGQAE